MNKTKILSVLSLAILSGGMCIQAVDAASIAVNVNVFAGVVTYGALSSFTFTNYFTTSFDPQTLAEDFTGATNYLWIKDLKGSASGYNTTLQMSGNLVAGTDIISGSNVSFKTVGSIVTISGVVNTGVQFDTGTAIYQPLNIARTFIFRPVSLIYASKLGYYGSNINLQVNLPGSQPAGAYAGFIIYTLIEN